MDFAAEMIAQNRAFADLAFGADPQTPVPTCPDWTLAKMYRHVGGGDRWAAQMVADRMSEFLPFADVRGGRAPEDPDEARAWVQAGPQTLIDAVAASGADTPVWTFIGPRPAQWWIRRRLHEIVVHHADAAIAVGAPFEPDPALAADAISEFLDLAVARGAAEGRSLHLHATDAGLGEAGEWTIADGVWTHSHGKGDVALRGSATDLLLAVTRRRPLADTSIELFGDEKLWQDWLSATPF